MFAKLHRFGPPLLAVCFSAAAAANLVDVFWPLSSARHELLLDLVTFSALTVTGLVAWRTYARARRTGRELRSSEARRRSVMDEGGDAVIVIDDQARIVSFNAAAERMFGYSAVEIVGDSLERLMTDGMRKAHAAHLAATGVTAMVKALDLRSVNKGVRKLGDVFPFELTMTEWTDDGRRMFTGVLRDVSETARAASALQEVQARYAALYENSPQPLFVYAVADGGEFVLESMNRAAEVHTGFKRTDLVGRTPEELAEPEEARGLKRALLHCLQGNSGALEETGLSWRGECSSLGVTLAPLPDASGEITRILASVRENARPSLPMPAAGRAA